GFEQMVIGMAQGESKTATIGKGEAYGDRREELVFRVDRSQLPPELKPEVGQELYMQQEGGMALPVLVVDTDESSITIDANHPLAGLDLTFEVQLVSIDSPSKLIITP